MPLDKIALRRTALASAVMLAAMMLIWWFVWTVAATQYSTFIDRWIVAHRPAGYSVQYTGRAATGFPRRLTLHFANFVLQNADGVRIHSDGLDLSTLPWRWHKLKVTSAHGFDIAIPFGGAGALTVTAKNAVGAVDLDQEGDWRLLRLGIAGAEARFAQKPFFAAGTLALTMTRPPAQPTTAKEAGLTLASSAADLALPSDLVTPFGGTVEKLALELRVMGAVPDPRKKESVAAWSAAGGLVDFDRFDLDWGPLLFRAKGALDPDDDLQPEGAFLSRIGHQDVVIKALMDHGEIPARDAGMLDQALKLFAKPVEIGGTEGITVPITVQWDGLFLGPVKVFDYPALSWATPAPAAPLPATAASPSPAIAAPAPMAPSLPAASAPVSPTP
ncbi:MAG TPA: DUF2125 domain-containing protein [Alphaproteobacteria bacterium]|nr:DUF2125 domain-containing protein [Alphaproteobacteria bacterium]